MKVLVIPDVHLKPWMFKRAYRLMKDGVAQKAVCLMDIPDDWGQEQNIDLYKETYDTAIAFAKEFPETRWCYGNHDLSYLWNQEESGFSRNARDTVVCKLHELDNVLSDDNKIQYVHRIDKVMFSHGGVSERFVRNLVSKERFHDTDYVLDTINHLGYREMWRNSSPIWVRPQFNIQYMYMYESFLQVVGHTPVEDISVCENVVSTDVFSTYRNGTPIGSQRFAVVDTITFEVSSY